MSASNAPQIRRLTPRARLLLPVVLLLFVALTVRQLWCSAPERVVLQGPTMGTTFQVVLNARGQPRAQVAAARSAAVAALSRVSALMSTWDPESELSRLNRSRSSEPFPVSPSTLEVLTIAQRVSERSGGAFDVTVGPLVAAWGFGANARLPGQGPDEEELAQLRQRVGYRLLELGDGVVRKLRPGVEIDLSAIAKGYGVDEVARELEALGFGDYLVEVGGEVRTRGRRPDGGLWRVGIERPGERGRIVQGVVELADQAMATSGDYRSYYLEEGRRTSHFVDPRSGRPAGQPPASVSVIHDEAVWADAWATALSVLGPDEGLAVADREGLAAWFLIRRGDDDFEVRASSAFPTLVDERPGPGVTAGDGERAAGSDAGR